MKYFDYRTWRNLTSEWAKIDLLSSQYENFKMHANKAIDDMLTRFTHDLISLGEPISNNNKVRKII